MLKIGWSRRDVSTNEPVLITGQFHGRVSKGVLDPIMLNCLVLDDGKDLVIFLSGDFVNGGRILDDIRKKTAEKNPEIPVEKIIFYATHTHCGPAIGKSVALANIPHEGLEIADSGVYYEFLSDSAADAIAEAFQNRQEGSIAYGYGFAVVSHSRRVTYMDDFSQRTADKNKVYKSLEVNGHAVMYGNTNDEMFCGYEGGADHYINLLYTFDREKKLTGAIINVPCPSQNAELESVLTADYWNDVRLLLREKYGDIHILPQCAAAGDLSPRTLHYRKAEDRRYALKYADTPIPDLCERPREVLNRKEIAQRICAAFDEVLDWAKKDLQSQVRVRHSVKEVALERWLIPEEAYQFACQDLERLAAMPLVDTGDPQQDYYHNSIHVSAMARSQRIIERYHSQQESKSVKMELHTIRVGEIAFATNPFELYIDYQHRIQARSPFTQTFIVQLCDLPGGNFCTGYLATARGEANVGYSANIYSNHVSCRGGETLVAETLAELNALYEE